MEPKTFTEFLVDARQRRGITAAEASRRCGVSPSHWSHFEHGRKTPDEHVLYAMSKLFSVSMERLYVLAHPSESDVTRMRVWNDA